MSALFDTHAHLGDAQFDADQNGVLDRASAAGVGSIVEIADEPSQWDAAIALARARPAQVRCSLGLHPYYADQYDEALLIQLRSKVRLPEVVAVGEIGLDYVKAEAAREVQLKAFERLLEACLSWDVPAVIHCRGAYEDLRAVLERLCAGRPVKRFLGVIHCFSGTSEDAMACAKLGFALGVDGPVTYPKNDLLRGALKSAGLDFLVLETDSPYLPPQSSRGKRNEPSAIPEIAAAVAKVFGIKADEAARVTTVNARALFRL